MSARTLSLTALLAAAAVCTVALGAQNPFWPIESPPKPLAAREVKFPPYEIRALANGMQVIMVSHHEQPAVTMHLLVRAGAAHDPDTKKAGIGYLVAQLLDQGTTTKSAFEIADQIDSIGGLMNVSAQQDRTIATAVVMKDSFTVGLELIADIVGNPAFDPAEVERQKQQAISLQQVNGEDPDYIANMVFNRLVYGFHPYGMTGTGTPETLAAITRDDLREFHRRHYVPNNMLLAIVGDVTRDEAFAAAERVFGPWKRGDVPPIKAVEPPPSTRRVVVVDKPDSVQTEIRVGQLAIPRKHPDYIAWNLAIRILGGEGANRLHRVLRSERGLTYGASAAIAARKLAGDYFAETDTRTEATGEVLRLIRDELIRLQRVPVSRRELADAQAYLSGSFPLTIETPNDIASQVLNTVFFELPLDEIGTFHTRVSAVTPEDVQRVAKQYIRPDNLSVVLVGNARRFLPQLEALGLTSVDVIPLGELDLTSPTLRRDRLRVDAGRPPAVVAAPWRRPPRAAYTRASSSAVQARGAGGAPGQGAAAELLRRVVEARGGLEALKAVRTVVADATTTFMDEQGKPAATTMTRTYVQYPDKFRVDATIQKDVVSQIYNAGQAWEKSPAGVREMPPQARADAAASVRRDTIPMLIAAMEGRLSVKVAAGSGAERVLEISGRDFDPVRLHINDDMLIVRQEFTTTGPDGRPLRAEETFSDYRQVDGVRVPFQAAVLRDGRIVVTRTLTKVVINEPIDPSLFARPN